MLDWVLNKPLPRKTKNSSALKKHPCSGKYHNSLVKTKKIKVTWKILYWKASRLFNMVFLAHWLAEFKFIDLQVLERQIWVSLPPSFSPKWLKKVSASKLEILHKFVIKSHTRATLYSQRLSSCGGLKLHWKSAKSIIHHCVKQRFSPTRIFLYLGRVVESALIRENAGQRKSVFRHILHSTWKSK